MTTNEERRQKIIAEMQEVVEAHSPFGDDDPGLSTREWSKTWEISIKTTRRRLRDLWELGMLARGKKAIERIDGTSSRVTVYRAK